MRRYLLAALWPAGMAAIGAVTVIAARRAAAAERETAAPGRVPDNGFTGSAPAAANGSAPPGPAGTPPPAPGPVLSAGRAADTAAASQVLQSPAVRPVPGGPAGLQVAPGQMLSAAHPGGESGLAADLARLAAMSAASGILSYGVMALIGPAVIGNGPAIDQPMYDWVNRHQVRVWAAIMERANKIGNTWTTWGAAYTGAACLAVSYPRKKWLPPAVLGSAILVDHYATIALRYTFGRLGPPGSPGGTYPSGGTDRVVLFYGALAHMLWRQFSGTARGRVYALGIMSALAFNQAYAREYCSKHWFSDIIAGLLYGSLLLVPYMAAVRWIAGPPAIPARPG